MGLLVPLYNSVTWQRHLTSQIAESNNFNDYDVLQMNEVPDIEVHILKSTDKMGGIGEPGVPPLAPAVANAFFNATGVRVRRIPLTPKFVQDVFKKA